jgi:uncharacterized protein (TIGR02284 family)
MKYSEIISNKLNELLIKNFDAEKGYEDAANIVNSPKLKALFKMQSEQRGKFARELRLEILKFGQIPEESGSLKGSLHRNWMQLKSMFTSETEEAILEEALRGEEASLSYYDDILSDTNLPLSIENMLIEQKQSILRAINKLKLEEELVS